MEILELTANKHASKLFLDLLSSYNKLVRPVQNSTERVTVQVKLKLSQLLDIVIDYYPDYIIYFKNYYSNQYSGRKDPNHDN